MSAVFPITADLRFRLSTSVGGETSFSVPFPFQNDADLTVTRIATDGTETVLANPANYTVTGAGEAEGGTVHLVTPATAGEIYIRAGAALLQRVLGVVRAGRFASAAIDNDIDRFVIVAQELARDRDRSLKLPLGNAASGDLEAPVAGKFLAWNADATGLDYVDVLSAGELAVSGFMQTLLGTASAEALRTALSVQSVATLDLRFLNEPPQHYDTVADFEAATVGDDVTKVWLGSHGGLAGDDPFTAEIVSTPSVVKPWHIQSDNGRYARIRFPDGRINAKFLGADGNNATDDTAAIQYAIDYFEQAWHDNSGILNNLGFVYLPPGIYRIDPGTGVNLVDYCRFLGSGRGSTMLKAYDTGAGSLVKRPYVLEGPHERVEHVEIGHMRGIATAPDQILFDLQHIGRLHAHHLMGTTQDREDEYNNAKQQHHAGSAFIAHGVGDSVPNGYIGGSDICLLEHLWCNFMDFGVLVAGNANQKAPERFALRDFEFSGVHQPVLVDGGLSMRGTIRDGTVQYWGTDAIDAATGMAASSKYGIDYKGNKFFLADMYFEGDDELAGVLTREGSNNVVPLETMNRYGSTSALHSDGGTDTITSF